MNRPTEVDKAMIILSATAQDANKYIDENFHLETWEEKVKFLEENFEVEGFGPPDEISYWAALNAIVLT